MCLFAHKFEFCVQEFLYYGYKVVICGQKLEVGIENTSLWAQYNALCWLNTTLHLPNVNKIVSCAHKMLICPPPLPPKKIIYGSNFFIMFCITEFFLFFLSVVLLWPVEGAVVQFVQERTAINHKLKQKRKRKRWTATELT